MEVIKEISKKIDDELEDAEKYIKCALKKKQEYPQLADAYFKLSLEEMNHVAILHDQVVRIITEYKKSHEVPPAMQTIYDYLHERQIGWAEKIKRKQEAFK